MLILSEIILKYTSLSLLVAISYFALPLIISLLFYVYLVKKITTERIVK